MLKFKTNGSPEGLISAVFDITIDGKEANTVQRFPREPLSLDVINLFAVPEPHSRTKDSFFVFNIGDTAVSFQYGFVKYRSFNSAVCVISDYYYPDLYRSILYRSTDEIVRFATDPPTIDCSLDGSVQ